MSPQELGAFMHAIQTPMSGAPFFIEELRVHALPVIPDPQPKLPFVIPEFHFYLLRLCVPEGIAQRLGGNPVDFVSEYRMEVPRCPLHLHTKHGRILVRFIRREFFPKSAYGQGQIVAHHLG